MPHDRKHEYGHISNFVVHFREKLYGKYKATIFSNKFKQNSEIFNYLSLQIKSNISIKTAAWSKTWIRSYFQSRVLDADFEFQYFSYVRNDAVAIFPSLLTAAFICEVAYATSCVCSVICNSLTKCRGFKGKAFPSECVLCMYR